MRTGGLPLAESAGVSIHVYARMLVTTSIGQLEISNGINAIRDEQLALRIAIARAIEAILINTTDLEETTIRRFTRDKLLQDIPQSKDAKGKP